ncbi:Dynamin family protein [Pyrenochaeta sp. MPI-SDFR-AT-0127]|nr:Dynamin family protein [Pyrenochaeta sp. MPI-SDFR-AT-0127]
MLSKEERVVPSDSPEASFSVGLQTTKSSRRLNQIDRVRAKGVGDHIALPQLVVCGDQSAGKSSVLEGITGIPFPRQEGLCTRFATEIILRHQPGTNRITAKVLPSASRTEDDRLRMASCEWQLSSFDDLPGVIEKAATLMGIGEQSATTKTESPSFASDVLRLEVVGDTGLHLTVVDLPGLISVSENPEDMRIVENLVDRYLESTRTIILAVVPAYNDIDTQGIIQRARKFDKAGERTVGIITKPDLINKGTESRVASLAKNMDRVKLKLGFFIVKNPTPLELSEGVSRARREQQEMEFFNSSPWVEQNLDKRRVGTEKLRQYLQRLLDSHIERELPKVRQDVGMLLSETERQLDQIGPERSSVPEIRRFLTQVSMNFYNLTKAAVDGNYDGRDATFFSAGMASEVQRLRAKIHMGNERFAGKMRLHAAKRKVPVAESTESIEKAQLQVTNKHMMKWVEKIYHNTRGRELPGNYNHILLAELFHEQSSLWGDIAKEHLRTTCSVVNRFISTVLDHIIPDSEVRLAIHFRIRHSLNTKFQSAEEELNKILMDEQMQPITYNHYYTDNIQKARVDAAQKNLQNLMDCAISSDWTGNLHVSNTKADLRKLSSSLKAQVVVDMTQQACVESLAALDAYYKVAMKTFIDNICRQVIERHLLNGLANVFDPLSVGQLSEGELVAVGGETPEIRDRRNELEALRQALEESLLELQD